MLTSAYQLLALCWPSPTIQIARDHLLLALATSWFGLMGRTCNSKRRQEAKQLSTRSDCAAFSAITCKITSPLLLAQLHHGRPQATFAYKSFACEWMALSATSHALSERCATGYSMIITMRPMNVENIRILTIHKTYLQSFEQMLLNN